MGGLTYMTEPSGLPLRTGKEQKVVAGKAADSMPARISTWAIYDVFQTKDDPIFINIVTDALSKKFCKLFALDDLWADESFRNNHNRVAARDRIMSQIGELAETYQRDDLKPPKTGWYQSEFVICTQSRKPRASTLSATHQIKTDKLRIISSYVNCHRAFGG